MEPISGILGLLILIADIWAILQILKSGADTPIKLVWIVVIVVLPVIGLLIWLVFGPRG